jgi:hypothetical protein
MVRVMTRAERVDYDPALLHKDPDAPVMLLAAVVIRSGYAWQPSLTRKPGFTIKSQ